MVSEILDLRFDFSFTLMYLGNMYEGLSRRDSYLLKIYLAASEKDRYKILAEEPSYHHFSY